jgi:hypothetical protein
MIEQNLANNLLLILCMEIVKYSRKEFLNTNFNRFKKYIIALLIKDVNENFVKVLVSINKKKNPVNCWRH